MRKLGCIGLRAQAFASRRCPRSSYEPYLTDIGPVRRRAADRIDDGTADQQIEIGPLRSERIVPWRAEFLAHLPPPMLPADNPRIETRIEAGAGAHAGLRRLYRNPVSRANVAGCSGVRVQLHFRMQGAPPQARYRTVLAFAKQRVLNARQYQRIASREVWPRHRPDERLLEFGQRLVSVVAERLGIKLHLARGRIEITRNSGRTSLRVLAIIGLQRHPDPPGCLAQRLEGDPGWSELVAVRRVDVPAPEVLAQAETGGEPNDDLGIRTG